MEARHRSDDAQNRLNTAFLGEVKEGLIRTETATRERVALLEQATIKAHERIDDLKTSIAWLRNSLWGLTISLLLMLVGWVIQNMMMRP